MKLNSDTKMVIGGVLLAVLAAWYLKNKVAGAVDAVADAAAAVAPYVNPADSNNIINQGVGAIGGAISGDENWSLGTWLYDLRNL